MKKIGIQELGFFQSRLFYLHAKRKQQNSKLKKTEKVKFDNGITIDLEKSSLIPNH